MCGFAGYILSDRVWENEDYTKHDLLNISKLIYHRGPDDNGIYSDKENKLGLAFQRLSILDLSVHAKQPMISKSFDWIIVFNGEIYNYLDLKNTLSDKSIIWKSTSDTEVVLECIANYGFAKAISMIDGMFAIAAYNFKSKSLWLARDKFGEKPIYYGKDKKNNFFFSSDIKALMSSKYFQKKINYNTSADYLRYGYVPDPLSILEDIHKLSPGQILKYDFNKKIKVDEYWNTYYEFLKMRESPFKGTYESAKEEMVFNIKNATSSRLAADVPVGAFLSGGIDSSSLVLSLKTQGYDLDTFSIGFKDKNKNEAQYANEVALKLNTNHNEKILDDNDCLNIIPDIVKCFDEPFSDPSQIPTFLLARFAKKKIKVAISGDGADELFGGYPRYKNISKLWSNLKISPKFLKKNIEFLPYFLSDSKYRLIKSLGKKIRKISHSCIESLYNDELSRWRPDEGMYERHLHNNSNFNKTFNYQGSNISDYRYIMFRDLITYLPSNLLVKIDRSSMANSLEVRSPFLDPNLAKFAWSLPDKFLYKNKYDKFILRDILSKKFSSKIYARKKQGFEPPLDLWLKGPLKEWAFEIIEKNDDFINKNKLKFFYQSFLKGEKKLTYKLWSLIMFKAWRDHNAL
ncbi:MAG: asparagine synthase (glutamine-hydrolyzing) [Alphaproteobacteria bacterium TMED93]|nr:MAG: asparagine synthase (glutamine-hydrolyzing) [Alphaproteobacteria bacterium TMED93]